MVRGAWEVLAAAGACFLIVGLGLHMGRVPGIAWRQRFIARRESEPYLYWFSLSIFAAVGAFLTIALLTVH